MIDRMPSEAGRANKQQTFVTQDALGATGDSVDIDDMVEGNPVAVYHAMKDYLFTQQNKH